MRLVDDPEIRAVMAEVGHYEKALPPLLEDVERLQRIGNLGRIKLRDLALAPVTSGKEKQHVPEPRSAPIEDWSQPPEALPPRATPTRHDTRTVTLAEVQQMDFPVLPGHDHGVDLSQPKWVGPSLVCGECNLRIKIDPDAGEVRHAAA